MTILRAQVPELECNAKYVIVQPKGRLEMIEKTYVITVGTSERSWVMRHSNEASSDGVHKERLLGEEVTKASPPQSRRTWRREGNKHRTFLPRSLQLTDNYEGQCSEKTVNERTRLTSVIGFSCSKSTDVDACWKPPREDAARKRTIPPHTTSNNPRHIGIMSDKMWKPTITPGCRYVRMGVRRHSFLHHHHHSFKPGNNCLVNRKICQFKRSSLTQTYSTHG